MILVDAHAHLDDKSFKDISEVVGRAEKVGVKEVITNGVGPASNRKSLEIARKFSIVKAALGIYPCEADKMSSEEISAEIDFIEKNKNKVIAIGEVGLDFYWKPYDEKKQKDAFQKFIGLSERLRIPLIVHSRKAEAEVIEMIESSRAKPLIHCFGGSMKLAKRIADNGWSFSIPCIVVRDDHFQRLVREVNISQLLTETDSPYLAARKDERNEPAFVLESVRKIASLKGLDVEEAANIIYMNYQRLFK
ncbi:TatD family deoxyribonuclease [Candidatus Woesearchaeota archaeon]|nr:MAG: TatD family deoxyribonuclease [Candidatus Woesearchaeota archaeon]